jgi:pimeloyl-ACP methyl ester carboxylesterase
MTGTCRDGMSGVSASPSCSPAPVDAQTLFPEARLYRDGSGCRQLNLSDRYFIDHVAGGSTLVVSFFGRGGASGRTDEIKVEYPWGYKYLRSRGYSLLGVKPVHADWYRSAELHRFFESPQLQGWLSTFDRVIFYGCSMGGYAAVAFSRAFPGAEVIAMSPQSTLDRRTTGWDPGFPEGQAADWEGAFSDAADSMPFLSRLWLVYDPTDGFDRLHVGRLRGPKTVCLPMMLTGHNTASALQQLDLLKWVFDAVAEELLTPSLFHQMLRQRREHPLYFLYLSRRVHSQACKAAALERADALIAENPSLVVPVADLLVEGSDLLAAQAWLLRFQIQSNKALQAKVLFRLSKVQHRMGVINDACRFARSAAELQPQNKVYGAWAAGLPGG